MSFEKEILVSVIIPCFNSSKTIDKAIKSVLEQSNKFKIEIILIDDFSEDDTLKKIKNYVPTKNVIITVLKNEKNMGTGYSRDKGIASSKGLYVAFLDADDYWLPNKLENQINFFRKNKNAAIVYSDYFLEKKVFNHKYLRLVKTPSKVSIKINRFINHIPNSTAILESKLAKKFNYPFIKIRNDYIYWNKILNYSNLRAFNCSPGKAYVVYGSYPGISSNKIKLISYQWRTYREYFNYGIFFSLLGIVLNIINTLVKR